MEIKSSADINERIKDIWTRFPKDSFEDVIIDRNKKEKAIPFLYPGLIPSLPENPPIDLLVIGLNPSFSVNSGWMQNLREIKKHKELSPADLNNPKIHKDLYYKLKGYQFGQEFDALTSFVSKPEKFETELMAYLTFTHWDDKKINDLSLVEYTSFRCHSYFKKMWELANHVLGKDKPWYHLDLYLYRKTSQKELEKLIEKHNEFFIEQKLLTKEIIMWLQPKYILVANAYAGEIFRSMFRNELQYEKDFFKEVKINEDTGTYLLKVGQTESHLFFSSMLSSQHSLDLGSFDRLKWHMKAVKDGRLMVQPVNDSNLDKKNKA